MSSQGASMDQDSRFADKQKKLMKSMNFPKVYNSKVDMKKVKLEAMKPWITKKVVEIVGLDDDLVVGYVFELLEAEKVDPKDLHINLTGFLEGKTQMFVEQLWILLLSAQSSPYGIPQQFLDEKKMEIIRSRAEADKLANDKAKMTEKAKDIVKPMSALEQGMQAKYERPRADGPVGRHSGPPVDRDRERYHDRDSGGGDRDRDRERDRDYNRLRERERGDRDRPRGDRDSYSDRRGDRPRDDRDRDRHRDQHDRRDRDRDRDRRDRDREDSDRRRNRDRDDDRDMDRRERERGGRDDRSRIEADRDGRNGHRARDGGREPREGDESRRRDGRRGREGDREPKEDRHGGEKDLIKLNGDGDKDARDGNLVPPDH